jgi:hypothetical protein
VYARKASCTDCYHLTIELFQTKSQLESEIAKWLVWLPHMGNQLIKLLVFETYSEEVVESLTHKNEVTNSL